MTRPCCEDSRSVTEIVSKDKSHRVGAKQNHAGTELTAGWSRASCVAYLPPAGLRSATRPTAIDQLASNIAMIAMIAKTR
ncbi:MAG: hypothetical protein ACI9TF_000382 [Paracrocinitomix sp.]|jgi:hypothetical protein